MSDGIDPAAYRDLVARAGLDPAIVREVEIKLAEDTGFGPGTYLRPGESARIPGGGLARFEGLGPGGEPIVKLPLRLLQTGMWYAPAHDLVLAAAPATPREYWRRREALAARVAALRGRLQVSGGREAGWVPVVERMVDAIVRVMGPTDAVEIVLQENGGSLFAIVHAVCRDPERRKFIWRVGEWAEAATVRRCAVLGITGWYGPVGRGSGLSYTLSGQVRALGESALIDRIYPRPPLMSEGDGDV